MSNIKAKTKTIEVTVDFEYYLIYAEDTHGNFFTTVVDDTSDTINVYDLLDLDRNHFSFESEAYYLNCAQVRDQGIACSITKHIDTKTVEVKIDIN